MDAIRHFTTYSKRGEIIERSISGCSDGSCKFEKGWNNSQKLEVILSIAGEKARCVGRKRCELLKAEDETFERSNGYVRIKTYLVKPKEKW
jgi:hypothetical protein